MRFKAEWLGWGLSLVYLSCVGLFVYLVPQKLLSLELNAIGDFLAGVFGPIAFLWLVLGYRQQGTELRMQAAELKASVEQQTEMVKAQQVSLQNYERSLEPLLKLEYSGERKDRNGCSEVFLIKNAGSYCDSIVIKVTGNGETRAPVSVEPLHKDAAHEFLIPEFISPYVEQELVVSYTKRSGLKNWQAFSVRKSKTPEEASVQIMKRPLQGWTLSPEPSNFE